MKNPVFHKTKARFDEMMMEYSTDQLSVDFFGDSLNFAKSLITEINNKCNKFYEFKYYLKYRHYTIISMFFVLPVMFFLGVIGFTNKAFILSWFFFTFLFVSMFFFFLILYFLSGKIMKQFVNHSQMIQEIIDRYNIDFFIDKQFFVYFRTKSIDYNTIPQKNRENMEKNKGNSKQITFKLRFYVQSRLLRIIRSFFWIEFLSFGEIQHKKQDFPHQNLDIYHKENSNIKQLIANSAMKQSLPNSAFKKSQLSQNLSPNGNNLSNSKEKSIISLTNQRNNSQYKTPERRIEENDEIIEKSDKNQKKNLSESPMKFDESSEGKSEKKPMNFDLEGVEVQQYFNEQDPIKVEEEENEENMKKTEKNEEKDDEFDF